MAGPSQRPSFPFPSEPGLRRLGVGGPGGGDRPLRAQIVVAVVALLVLTGVPLYLLRRPSAAPTPAPSASASAFTPPLGLGPPVASGSAAPASAEQERLTVGPVVRVRCGARPGRGLEGPSCDRLEVLEEALARAVKENPDCAPRIALKEEGTINYVLSVDFSRRQLHVFAGQSGNWRGPQAKKSAQCVKRKLAAPQWNAITHQHRHYQLAVLATYRPPRPSSASPGDPLFE